MTSTRRNVIKMASAGLAGAGLAACGSGHTASVSKPAFVFVHGAWHGAWCWQKVTPELAREGYCALAIDLPGHGLNAQFPSSYFERPLNAANFATEVSAVAAVSVDQCADAVVAAIEQLRAGGFEKVIVVAHSAGGVAVTQAVERIPRQISAVVYLSAFMLANGQTALETTGMPEGSSGEVSLLLRANPAEIGALRIDAASNDRAYLDQIKSAFYGDVADADLPAIRNLLTPDSPVALGVTPTAKTTTGWGSVPRHYIKCHQDRAIPAALQQKFIDVADANYPTSKTTVHTLNASHSPFLSTPRELSVILSSIARALG